MRKRLVIASAMLLVVAVLGFGGSLLLNSMVFDKYDAYGEVPIPGTRTLHLPAGDVKVSFHTEIAGTMEGGGLPIPQNLEVTISPPDGVAEPTFARNIGGTDADNQDARVQVGTAQIRAPGDYTITTDGKASAFLSPRLAFGHRSNYGFLPWLFVGLAAVSLLALLASALSPATRELEKPVSQDVSRLLADEDARAATRWPKIRTALLLITVVSVAVLVANVAGIKVPFIVVIAAIVVLSISMLLFALRLWIRRTHTPEELAARQAQFRTNKDQINSAKGTTKYKREVIRTGTEGRAVITAIKDLGHGDETRRLVYLELEVTVGAGAPYAVSTGEHVGIVSAGSVAVGRELVVRVDPSDPQRVAVDWEQSLRLRQMPS
jgi:hypothetical protein